MPELTRPVHGVMLRLIDPIYFVREDDWNQPSFTIVPSTTSGAMPVIPAKVEITEELSPKSFDAHNPNNWARPTYEDETVEVTIKLRIPRHTLMVFAQ